MRFTVDINVFGLLLIGFLFIGCNKEDAPIDIEYCDFSHIQENCGLDSIRLNLCLDCFECRTDNRLSNISHISVHVERSRSRFVEPFYSFKIDSSFQQIESFCVPRIPEIDSSFVAFHLVENGDFDNIDLTVFDKISTSQDVFDLKIEFTDDNLWAKTPCTEFDFFTNKPIPEDQPFFGNFGLIGSMGIGFGAGGVTDLNLNEYIEEMKQDAIGY